MQQVVRPILLTAMLITVGNSAAVGQGLFTSVSVGSHAGLDLGNGEVDDGRLGGHVIVSLVGPLELWTGFNAEVDPPVFSTIEGDVTSSIVQGLFSARIRPFGTEGVGSLWYLGYGLTFRRASVKGGSVSPASQTEWTDLTLTGLELPVSPVRPFAELQLLDIFDRESSVSPNLYFGVNLRLR